MELEPANLVAVEPPDELLVIRNPVSANSQRAQHQIAELQEAYSFRAVDVLPTLHDPDAAPGENRRNNQRRIINELQERVDPNNPDDSRRCWLVIATGDGTIRDASEALLDADDAIRKVPILPLAGGGGNDFSSMTHGFWGKRWPVSLMDKARIEAVQPLEFTIVHPDGSIEKKYANSYGSIGELIAKAAKVIDQDRGYSRFVHLVREKVLAARSVSEARPTTIQERGIKREIGELVFSNGRRMAKYLRWDQELGDPQFLRTEVPSVTKLQVAVSGIKLALGRHRSTVVPDGNHVHIQTASDTWIQLDGEAFPLLTDTSVTVRRSPKSLNIVHLR